MKTTVPQITFPFIYSLMLHTVFITILLLLSPPLYRISSDFPFVNVRLYSSFLSIDKNKSINKALQKSAAFNETKIRQNSEEIHPQSFTSLQDKKAEVKTTVKEKWTDSSGKDRENKLLKQKNLDLKKDTAPLQSITQETKGIILPEPYGDLKLEIKIEEGLINNIKTTVAYREFLKKQRNRPLKKSEINYIRVEPKIINSGNNIMTIIVEAAGEGIYNFMIESDNKPLKVILTVKLYEKSAKQKSKTLGTMTVDDKITVKILMPEGILWDDDSYFSGYMEDSESITKFNADSGLVWKEYKE